MGYRGKLEAQEKARALRGENRTLADIAEILGVAKSSVSVWVRDVPFTPSPRRTGPQRRPNPLHERRLREIEECNAAGVERIGQLSEATFLIAGVALYAGEGAKTEGAVKFTNSNSEMIRFFCAWFRHLFEIDESRMRIQIYLHEGLDLHATEWHWSEVTGIPRQQFIKAYRAEPDASIRNNKHEHGCVTVYYCCSRTHREIMGLIRALLSFEARSGVAQ